MAVNLTQAASADAVWKVGNSNYLVYFVPETQPPVPLIYRIESWEDYEALGSPSVDKEMNWREARRQGVIQAGGASEVQNLSEHPFQAFVNDYDQEAAVNPMLRDPEVLAIYAQSVLEGRTPTRSELESTEYWRSRTPEQREWEKFAAGDPRGAKQRLEDNRIKTRELLHRVGLDNPADELIDYFARRLTTGEWSQEEYRAAIKRVNDPFAPGATPMAGRSAIGLRAVTRGGRFFLRDAEGKDWELKGPGRIARFENHVSTSNVDGSEWTGYKEVGAVNPAGEADELFEEQQPLRLSDRPNFHRVKSMAEEWLGPVGSQGWTDFQIGKWASILERNPDAEGTLIKELQRQRLAQLPEYENENLSYEDIASTWRGLFMKQWGQIPDESSDLFQQVIRMNDVTEASRKLRTEGMKQGVEKVVMSALEDTYEAFGPGVRGGVGY